jgi:F420-non-reducing hydrogenase iron-sulfur subunit
MSTDLNYKPKILGIVCNWCCYGGADLCGVSRFQYPPYIRLIRVMCSARVDLTHIFRAFSNGQDAVFVGGCHIGDCHYVTHGNYHTLSTIYICKKILGHVGINPERLRLEWVSAGEGIKFAEVMNDFGNKVKKLGPLGISDGIDEKTLKLRLEAVTGLVPYIRLVERERMRLSYKTEEEYHNYFTGSEFNSLFNTLILDKLAMSEIVSLLRERPLSTGEMAERLGLTPSEVSRHINSSSRQGLVRYDESQKRFALA